jgi:hypothetical protein
MTPEQIETLKRLANKAQKEVDDYKARQSAYSPAWGRHHYESLGAKANDAQLEVQTLRSALALAEQARAAMSGLEQIASLAPAHDGNGTFFYPQFDDEGNEIGAEYVDHHVVWMKMHEAAHEALAAANAAMKAGQA